MRITTRHIGPKIHCHPKTSPAESPNLMSKKYLPQQQRTRSLRRRSLRSVSKWPHYAYANQQARRLLLYLMTRMLRLRKFKVPKWDGTQRKQYGLSRFGRLDQLLIKASLCGNGHAGIVREYSILSNVEWPLIVLSLAENIGVLPAQ